MYPHPIRVSLARQQYLYLLLYLSTSLFASPVRRLSLCAGDALDPPLWTVVPNKARARSLSLSLPNPGLKLTVTGKLEY